MTVDQLKQYKALQREIEALNKAIVEMGEKGPSVSSDAVSSAAEWPYSKHTVQIDGLDWSEYERQMRMVLRKREAAKARAAAQLSEIEEYIAGIEDSELRQIVRCRFIEGLTWIQTAFRIGRHDEQYPRKKLDNFLKSTKSTISA